MSIIRVENLYYTYPEDKEALNNISFTVQEKDTVGVLGANGSGKTTLLFCLVNLLDYKGSIKIFDKEVKNHLYEIRKKIGFVFENPDDQLFNLTVYEDVAFALKQQNLKEEEIEKKVDIILSTLNLLEYKNRQPYHLSYGEKKKICLAIALVTEPEILILDEPTNNFDPASRREFIYLLKGIKETKIISTHDIDLAKQLCNKIVILNNGKLTYFGSKEILFDEKFLYENRLL